jgi:hypothetical protein
MIDHVTLISRIFDDSDFKLSIVTVHWHVWALSLILRLKKSLCRVLVWFSHFSLPSFRKDVLILREEEMGESEAHDKATLRPHASSDTSPALLLSTGQDVNCEAQPSISQAEGMPVTSISRALCRCILGLISFYHLQLIGSGENNMPKMDTDQSQRNDANNSNSDGPTPAAPGVCQIQVESQTCMDFLDHSGLIDLMKT